MSTLSKYVVLLIPICFTILFFFSVSISTSSQSQLESQTDTYKIYENRNLGIKFEYPQYLDVISENSDTYTCLLVNYCRVTLYDSLLFFETIAIRLNYTSYQDGEVPACNCNDTRDFAKWWFHNSTARLGTVINENETSIGKGYHVYLLEISSSSTNSLHIWTINNGVGYIITTLADDEVYKQNLNEIKRIISSIMFIKAEKITKRSILLDN